MKKISLKNLNIQEVDQLSREQLRNVLGGYVGGPTGTGTTTECTIPCKCDNGGGTISTTIKCGPNAIQECANYCGVSVTEA